MGASATSASVPSRLPTLTSVRFFAAFWVVVHHYNEEIATYVPRARTLLETGATGVSLFYVLSGFILAHTYWNRPVEGSRGMRDFLVHRFARIYPMYALSLIVLLPRLVLFRSDPAVVYAYAHPWITFFSHLTLTHSWFFYPTAVLNGPSWSVATEAGFYLLFPALLPLVRRVTVRGAVIGIVVAFVLSAILPALYSTEFFPRTAAQWHLPYSVEFDVRVNQAIRMWPIFRIGEFLIGMYLAVLYHRKPVWKPSERHVLTACVIAGLGLFAFSFQRFTNENILLLQQVTPVPFFAAGILALAVARGEKPKWLVAPPLILLGEASYSLYLLHIPSKHAMRILGERFLHLDMLAPIPLAVSILASVPISIAAFKYVETPARKWIVGRYAPRKTVGPPPEPDGQREARASA